MRTNEIHYEPDSSYHAQDADKLKVGSSMLREFSTNRYLFYRRYIERKAPLRESPAFSLGHAIESLICGLEKDVICSGMKTANSKAHLQAVADNPGKVVLTETDWELAHHLALEFQQNPVSGWVTQSGLYQQAVRIEMPYFYLQAKFDWYIPEPDKSQQEFFQTEGPVIVDFKTANTIRNGFSSFMRQVSDFGYIEQAALYQLLHHDITGVMPQWFWIVIEKDWPREIGIFKPDEDWLYRARNRVRGQIKSLSLAFENEDWENSPDLIEILTAPAWESETEEDNVSYTNS